MTENKRFTLKKWNDYAEGDCIYYDNGEEMGTLDVLDALNSLSKENEQLKQFKENVIKWVDSQMKFNVKNYIETEDYYFKSENIDLHNFKVFIGIDSDE